MEPLILLEEASPHGNADALVEDDGRAVFLYLRFRQEIDAQLRAVWVRNRVPAPATIDAVGMQRGEPPIMPVPHCRHPHGAPQPVPERLGLTWLPESDGVGLFEGDSLLAAIVPWSGQQGFDGYARDAVGQGPLAWELTPDNALHARLATAETWWARWGGDADPWPGRRDESMARLEAIFGKHARYFAIDGGVWPPKAVVWIPWGQTVVLATIGVALRPQPVVELMQEDPTDLRRVELGALVPALLGEAAINRVASQLGALASYPWDFVTWLGHGHSLDCDLLEDGRPAVILAESGRWGPRVELPTCDGDRTTLLWLVPVSAAQLSAKQAGGADAVLAGIEPPL